MARPRTLSMLALSLFTSIAFAQSRLGELLDAGARLISEEEFKLEVVQHPLIGRTAAGGAMEIMYVTNGTIQGLGATPQAPQLLVQATPIAGAWMIGPNGTICTTMQLHAAAGTVIALPTRCQYWYKHDGSYFISDSDSDRSAKVLRRSLKQ